MMRMNIKADEKSCQRSSALFCVTTLLLTSVANKYCSFYGGPTSQFQEFSKLLVTVVILFVGKRCNIVSFPGLSLDVLKAVLPLTLIHLCRLLFTLGGIAELSTSLVILLKKSSIIVALITERIFLEAKINLSVQISVVTIIIGALLAVSVDFSFDFLRSVYLLINVLLFVAYLILVSKILNATELGVCGLLYYNSLFTLLPISIIGYYTNDLESLYNYSNWANPTFSGCFFAFCVVGVLTTYSIISCTFNNSVLTTTMIDCFKDICISYISMTVWNDYPATVVNFCAVNVTLVGSLIYMYVTFRRKNRRIYHF